MDSPRAAVISFNVAMSFTHLDADGQPGMVDVGAKEVTLRIARAEALVKLPPEVLAAFGEADELESKKGPVLQTARLAGTMAVKRTSDLIPLCHPLPIEKIGFETVLEREASIIRITCEVRARYKTGVEMEALTGASVAALTVYDMCKALSHAIEIGPVRLVAKSGGKRNVGTV
jgi:cyclic pyranopterin phosphate synthase